MGGITSKRSSSKSGASEEKGELFLHFPPLSEPRDPT